MAIIRFLRKIVFSKITIFLVIILLIFGGFAAFGLRRFAATAGSTNMITHVVQRGDFVFDVTENGNVESARNVEIISKVRSMSGSGTVILEIVPEGTIIRPEDCIPEDAFVPLELIKQLEEYHRQHGIKLADYNTERDPRKREDLPRGPVAPSTAPPEREKPAAPERPLAATSPSFPGAAVPTQLAMAAPGATAGPAVASNGDGGQSSNHADSAGSVSPSTQPAARGGDPPATPQQSAGRVQGSDLSVPSGGAVQQTVAVEKEDDRSAGARARGGMGPALQASQSQDPHRINPALPTPPQAAAPGPSPSNDGNSGSLPAGGAPSLGGRPPLARSPAIAPVQAFEAPRGLAADEASSNGANYARSPGAVLPVVNSAAKAPPPRDLSGILPEVPALSAGKRVLTFEDVRDKMVLVRLDSASLENQRTQQQITCENSRASVVQALSNYEAALISLQEYLEGTYRQQSQDLLYQELMAEENLARAQQYLDYSKELYAKGYISERELQANEFDVQKKRVELDNIKAKRRVLDQYTREKMVTQLQADIESARARLEAARKNYLLDMQKLQEIEQQIANCTIFASRPGQVVYANERDYRGGNTIVIEPGTVIRERQVIIRLPDPSQMQVVARINEGRVSLVQPGMQARIVLDAFVNQELLGSVQEVSEYPAPTSFWASNIKEYEAKIRIENPPEGLRPGFTAQVKIRVAEQANVLQVPIQSVLEHGGKHYLILVRGEQLEAREVKLSRTNEKFVIVESGLGEGDVVVVNAREFRDRVNLPKLPTQSAELLSEAGAEQAPGDSATVGAQAGQPTRAVSGPGATDTSGADSPRRGPPGMPPFGPPRSEGAPGPGAPPSDQQAGGPPGGEPRGGRPDPAQFFQRLDRNGDGKLERDEVSGPLQAAFSMVDTNGDGQIDQAEFMAGARQFAPRGPRPPSRDASPSQPGGGAP